ncbi:hypothetical protein EV189_3289 [Motilibacter rhizosphaerae]|uniref:Lon N-terminal domain-containing protein n=1 Tax=Motilibacter rhizosphaerae TaxID=598652 RepID=A0A4Q7NGE4_9ACTN|nr:LON peptidase substrate-binding domain-containing protein [Motilibacter rhizosphaerae]RZS82892.1 hypothetical protein EV189_3289 [Motilibacter rhizosphaerae]
MDPADEHDEQAEHVGHDEQLALFPLGVPLLPGAELGLRVFEPRYRRMLATLLARPPEQRLLGVVALRGAREVGDDVAEDASALHGVGTVARITTVSADDDGTLELTAVGERRFRLLGVGPGPGEPDGEGPRWALGRVQPLDEHTGGHADELAVSVAELLLRYVTSLPDPVAADLDLPDGGGQPDALSVSWSVARAMVLSAADRQALLEAPTTEARLQLGRRLLRRETVLMQALPSLPIARADALRDTASAN